MKGIVFIFSLFLTFVVSAHGDMKSQIERNFTDGEIRIVKHMVQEDGATLDLFGENHELGFNEAVDKLGAFFKSNPAKKCTIHSQGTYNNGTRYFSGTYETEEGKTFDAYFEAIMDDHGHYVLSLIRFE